MMTSYDKLETLPEARQFLKTGIRFADLDAQATGSAMMKSPVASTWHGIHCSGP
jgi:hypothetical protein